MGVGALGRDRVGVGPGQPQLGATTKLANGRRLAGRTSGTELQEAAVLQGAHDGHNKGVHGHRRLAQTDIPDDTGR